MPTLRLNGIEVPALIDGASVEPFLVRDDARSAGGRFAATERIRKRAWRFRTKPLKQSDAEAWKGLIAGLGHRWGFEADLFSDKALGVSSSSGTNGLGGFGKHGVNCTAFDDWIQYATGAAAWTLSYFQVIGAGWAHRIARSDNARWANGARNDSTTIHPSVTTTAVRLNAIRSGTAQWAASTAYALGAVVRPTPGSANADSYYEATTAGTSGASQPAWPLGGTVNDGTVVWTWRSVWKGYYDDVVALPFAIPDAWVPELYAFHNANPWSALPRLRADGDVIRGGPIDVIGRVEETSHVPFFDSGAWTPGGESFAFTLLEC